MKRATQGQREVLQAMLWNRQALQMTDSEVLARVNKIARYPRSRGSVVDKLNALAQKGLVETLDDGPPRKRQITSAGVAELLDWALEEIARAE